MGDLEIKSIKNADLRAMAEIADKKFTAGAEIDSVFDVNGRKVGEAEGNGNGLIDTDFEKSALRGKIQKALQGGTLQHDVELDTVMESIGLKVAKQSTAAKSEKAEKTEKPMSPRKARKAAKKAHKEEVKRQAAALVEKLTYESESQDAKYIKKEILAKLEDKKSKGEINEELYKAAKDEAKGGVNLWQWLRGEQSAAKYRRHSVAHRNQVNFRAYNVDENGNRHTVAERVLARSEAENHDYKADGTEKTYTKEQLVKGFKYTYKEANGTEKKMKFKGIGEKNFNAAVKSGKYLLQSNGQYTIAKASEDVRLEVGSDYTADWSRNPNDSEQANIAGEMGLNRKGFLGIKNNKNARKVSKQLGYDTSNPLSAARIAKATVIGAAIGTLGAETQEALRPNDIVKTSNELNVKNVLNIDLGSEELAEQYIAGAQAAGIESTVENLGSGVVKIVTEINIFDSNVFKFTKDFLGAAYRGAIAGAIGGFVAGLLDGRESERSALPQIDCTKFPTVAKLQAHLDQMVKNGDTKEKYARIAMMIAYANADENGNIDCDSFNEAITMNKGNNIWNRREAETMGIDAKKVKIEPEKEPKKKEPVVLKPTCEEKYTDGEQGKTKTVPFDIEYGHKWDNIVIAKYPCLVRKHGLAKANEMLRKELCKDENGVLDEKLWANVRKGYMPQHLELPTEIDGCPYENNEVKKVFGQALLGNGKGKYKGGKGSLGTGRKYETDYEYTNSCHPGVTGHGKNRQEAEENFIDNLLNGIR